MKLNIAMYETRKPADVNFCFFFKKNTFTKGTLRIFSAAFPLIVSRVYAIALKMVFKR